MKTFSFNLFTSVDNLGGNDTLLLDMVRARSRELEEEAQDKTLELPREDVSDELVN